MNVVVFGSNSRTGQAVIKRALKHKYQITAFVQNPAEIEITADNLRIVVGHIDNPLTVDRALTGQHAAILANDPQSQEPDHANHLNQNTQSVIDAMERRGITRLITSIPGDVFAPKRRNNRSGASYSDSLETLYHSRLAWVAVCPPDIIEAPAADAYRIMPNAMPANARPLSTEDLAHFMVSQIKSDHYIGQAIGISR